jgi:serine/threonine-protein kinase RsbW
VDDERWIHEKLTAEPGAIRALRRRVRAWVDALVLEEDAAEAVVLIVDEAVTNAVEHACPGQTCEVELVAGPRACGQGFAVLVADDGRWHDAGEPGYRGRGLALIRRLSERSSVDGDENGTTVRMCWARAEESPAT